MKRLCYRCNERPAKRLPRPIKQSAAIFCSQACAADFALSYVHGESEIALYFCKEHGWDEDSEVECGECDSQRYSSNYLEKKRDLVRKRYAQAQEDESSIKREARKYWESWMLDPKTKTHWKV